MFIYTIENTTEVTTYLECLKQFMWMFKQGLFYLNKTKHYFHSDTIYSVLKIQDNSIEDNTATSATYK